MILVNGHDSFRFKACCLVSFFILSALGRAHARPIEEVPALSGAFIQEKLTGTFVMLDPERNTLLIHDAQRAQMRFIPASTFKIVNSLIALDCGAVKSVDEILPYGGKPQMIKAWEHDMSMRDAIRISNVPIYQEVARRVGMQRMRTALAKLEYGTCETGDTVDTFWLKGPLRISAVEQVDFLKRLTSGELPLAPGVVDAVRGITLLETSGSSSLHGKTGWATTSSPKVGWFVGWVEQNGKIYPFSLNIDMPDEQLAARRIPLAKECLRILGVSLTDLHAR